jgi:hypothetical protein
MRRRSDHGFVSDEVYMPYDVDCGVSSVAGLYVNLCARSPQGKSKGRVRPHVKRQAGCLDTLIPIPENLHPSLTCQSSTFLQATKIIVACQSMLPSKLADHPVV